MACEAASTLDVAVTVLAEGPADAAAAVATDVLVGAPSDEAAIRSLADRCQVVTFDHEQVDVDLLAALEENGAVVRPAPATLRMAVDKAAMRRRLAEAGVPVPAHARLGKAPDVDPAESVARFADTHGWPVVLKAVRGGYDGKGVWPVEGIGEVRAVCEQAAAAGVRLLVEEHVAIDAELAVLVARRPSGEAVTWPTVETVQVDGVCREVLLSGRLDPGVAAAAQAVAVRVAEVAGSTGVLAVELFSTGGRLLVNELAARPHNSGHWTIEGAVTSQFENHLRAVLDLPLGSATPTAAAVASVNVLGGPSGTIPAGGLATALDVEGAHVHLYGKEPRPGRKLGHVTVCGDDDEVRARAWQAARALGTPGLPA